MDTYSGLRPHLKELRADLARELANKVKVDARVKHLERAIEGIEGLLGPETVTDQPTLEDNSPGATNGVVIGTPAIRLIMQENLRPWKAREIYNVLEQRGWLSPAAEHPLRGVEAAINRMWRRGEIKRVSPGRYIYTTEAPESQG